MRESIGNSTLPRRRGEISGGVKLHVKLPSRTNAGDPDSFLSSSSAADIVVKTLANYAQFSIKTPEKFLPE